VIQLHGHRQPQELIHIAKTASASTASRSICCAGGVTAIDGRLRSTRRRAASRTANGGRSVLRQVSRFCTQLRGRPRRQEVRKPRSATPCLWRTGERGDHRRPLKAIRRQEEDGDEMNKPEDKICSDAARPARDPVCSRSCQAGNRAGAGLLAPNHPGFRDEDSGRSVAMPRATSPLRSRKRCGRALEVVGREEQIPKAGDTSSMTSSATRSS